MGISYFFLCLQRVQDRPLNGSFPPIYLSLVVGLFPTVGHTKMAIIPTLGLFIECKYAVSFNNLYTGKHREPDLHCIKRIVLICPPSLDPQPSETDVSR